MKRYDLGSRVLSRRTCIYRADDVVDLAGIEDCQEHEPDAFLRIVPKVVIGFGRVGVAKSLKGSGAVARLLLAEDRRHHFGQQDYILDFHRRRQAEVSRQNLFRSLALLKDIRHHFAPDAFEVGQ